MPGYRPAKISRFGLLELSRQRLAPSLDECSYTPCPRCNGIGHIRGTESSALHILRIIQEEAMKEHSAAIHVQVPVDVATFLLNEKRSDIHRIESRLKVSVTLIPNPHLETPHYSVSRLRHDDMTGDNLQASYKLVEKPDEIAQANAASQEVKALRPQAVVQGVTPAQPAPMRQVVVAAETRQPSFFSRLFGWFTPAPEAAPVESPAIAKPRSEPRNTRPDGRNKPHRERPEGNNKPRRDRADKPPRPAASAKPKEQRPERPPRPPRNEAPIPAEADNALPVAKAAGEQIPENGNREGRKRGRRGGRKERERREQQAPQNEVAQAGGDETADIMVAASTHELRETTPLFETTASMATDQVAAPAPEAQPAAAEIAPPAYSAPEPVHAEAQPAIETVHAPIPASIAQHEIDTQPIRITQPAMIEPPPAATERSAQSMLEQVETDPNKRVLAEQKSDVPPMPANRRRSRPRDVYSVDISEPLVQIETQRPPQ